MRYTITYLTGGERQVDQVEAPDAATAVSVAQRTYGDPDRSFELLSVLRLDDVRTARSRGEGAWAPTP